MIPLSDPLQQLSFIQACRQRGAKQISAGTGLFIVDKQPQAVRAIVEQTDYFFMNDLEAKAVFGSLESANTEPGKILYVTLGAQGGACIIQGDISTLIPAVLATELDPTGAGDTFCGATLAYLLQKKHPIMAARHAATLAAEMIAQVGPTALLSEDPPPEMPLDARVQVNDEQVRKVAEKISTLSEVSPFPFVSPELPPVGHPKALDYFFAATLQQFSFWSERNNRYYQPLIAKIGGVEQKGSDYLWETFSRRVEQDADFCSPERQANLSREELLEVFRADNGDDPMPSLDLHLEQAHGYGQDMLALQLTPQAVLQEALASAQPLQTFLVLLDQIGGYKEDPLRKKSGLLALILNQRPETFLPLREPYGGFCFGPDKPKVHILQEKGRQVVRFVGASRNGEIRKCLYPSFSFRDWTDFIYDEMGITWLHRLGIQDIVPEYRDGAHLVTETLVDKNAPGEQAFWNAYFASLRDIQMGYTDEGWDAPDWIPALVPQVWVQWHSDSVQDLRRWGSPYASQPQRIDFAVFWNNKRYAILIDGIQHYAVKRNGIWMASEEEYSKRLAEDRFFRANDWEVFRVSNWELRDQPRTERIMLEFQKQIGFEF